MHEFQVAYHATRRARRPETRRLLALKALETVRGITSPKVAELRAWAGVTA